MKHSNNVIKTKNIDEKKFAISSEFKNKLEELLSILNSSKNSIYIFYDNDSDGLCSFLQLKNSFNSIKGGHFITKEADVQKIAIDSIHPRTTHILFLDTPSIEQDSLLLLFERNLQVLILDHHSIQSKTLKSYNKEKKILYINPLCYDSHDSRPITYFSYLLSDKTKYNLELALIGSVADFYITPIFLDIYYDENFSFKDNPLTKNIKKEYFNNLISNLEKDAHYYSKNKEENAEIVQMLSYSTYIGTLKQFFDFIFKNTLKSDEHTKLVQSFTSISQLLGEINAAQYPPFCEFESYFKKYKKILAKAYKNFENTSNENISVLIIEHKGKTSYNRQLSENALYDKDIQVACSLHQKYERAFISGSIRSKPDIDLQVVLNQVFKGENHVKWGGHKQACGFQFPEAFKEKFKSKLFEVVTHIK